MAKYVLVYNGGGMPETEEEQKAVLARWEQWYGNIGEGVVDNGTPFGPAATVAPDGSVSQGGASKHTGYTIVTAENLDAASAIAKACPIVADGGTVEVYETVDMMM